MEPTVEQRKHPRHSVNFQGVFSSDTVKVEEGIVQDLSLGGCRVGSTTPAPIYVPTAIVRWVRGSAFGVQFQDLAEQESLALTRLLWSLPPSRQEGSPDPLNKT
jgi:hypothetical protein